MSTLRRGMELFYVQWSGEVETNACMHGAEALLEVPRACPMKETVKHFGLTKLNNSAHLNFHLDELAYINECSTEKIFAEGLCNSIKKPLTRKLRSFIKFVEVNSQKKSKSQIKNVMNSCPFAGRLARCLRSGLKRRGM